MQNTKAVKVIKYIIKFVVEVICESAVELINEYLISLVMFAAGAIMWSMYLHYKQGLAKK